MSNIDHTKNWVWTNVLRKGSWSYSTSGTRRVTLVASLSIFIRIKKMLAMFLPSLCDSVWPSIYRRSTNVSGQVLTVAGYASFLRIYFGFPRYKETLLTLAWSNHLIFCLYGSYDILRKWRNYCYPMRFSREFFRPTYVIGVALKITTLCFVNKMCNNLTLTVKLYLSAIRNCASPWKLI